MIDLREMSAGDLLSKFRTERGDTWFDYQQEILRRLEAARLGAASQGKPQDRCANKACGHLHQNHSEISGCHQVGCACLEFEEAAPVAKDRTKAATMILERRERMWKNPKQDAHNPHNIIDEPSKWRQWEFDAGRGSIPALHSYTRRLRFWWELLADPQTSDIQLEALEFLLGLNG
jgi:hypothetical protein